MITVDIIGEERLVARFKGAPQLIRERLLRAVRLEWLRLQGYIVASKLSGQVLKRRTGNLATSINAGGPSTASAFIEGPLEIVGRVGTKVWYGRVHELGGAFQIKPHVRTITQVFGRPIAPTQVQVRAYTAHFPERSFLRSGLRDMSSTIRANLARAAAEAAGQV
jgi:hypothetical protein